MKDNLVRVFPLKDTGDERGSSFSLLPCWYEFLRSPRDIHLTSLKPTCIRGNHYHAKRREVLLVVYADRWSLHWDEGLGTKVQRKRFRGEGAVLVEIYPSASHAIRNDGTKDLYICGLSNLVYDPVRPDAFRRRVV